MKKLIFLVIGLTLFLTIYSQFADEKEAISRQPLVSAVMDSFLSEHDYFEAYKEFLLHHERDEGDYDFPILGFFLLDLNFDNVPELAVMHHSGGSMGGYLKFYCFDGRDIIPVRHTTGKQARATMNAELLADENNQTVYILKEMYLLAGNTEGTYGYLREVIDDDGMPAFKDIINLEVDLEFEIYEFPSKSYSGENSFLSDPELENSLNTQFFMEDHWVDITSQEYLNLKTELIGEKENYIDLSDTGASHSLYENIHVMATFEIDFEISRRMTEEEIKVLFCKWLWQIPSDTGTLR